jgi:hypothetical protein
MSADNWAPCPQCEKIGEKRSRDLSAAADAAYGKVGADEYLAMLRQASEVAPDDERNTLREDYEIGISDGEFYIRYSGTCDKCGFKFTHKHDEMMVVSDTPQMAKAKK